MTEGRALPARGLGLRRSLVPALAADWPAALDFLEVAPENWIDIGGAPRRRYRELTARCPVACHGLSLNLGGTAPLDLGFLRQLKHFLDEQDAWLYSEHLSYCADDGQLYELLPIPFTAEAVMQLAARVRQVQDLLERRIAVENSSYYCVLSTELSEIDFIRAVLQEADCMLLLDVNNLYVNSLNHGYDAAGFLAELPGARIACGHVAGHRREEDGLLIDTHGAPVSDPVWDLLAEAYAIHGVFPTVLERDSNLPPLPALGRELLQIDALQQAAKRRAGRPAS